MAKLTDLTALTTPASGDLLHTVDVSDTTDDSAGSSRKITRTNFLQPKLIAAESLTGAIVGTSDSQTLSGKTISAASNTITNIGFGEVVADIITGQTEDLTPDSANDFLLSYDTSTTSLKKVKPANISIVDTTAIHKATSAEISALTEKLTPVSADVIVIEDSAGAFAKKKVQLGNLPAGSATDANAVHVNVAGEISILTQKATPTESDWILIEDAAATNAKKAIQLGWIPQLHATTGALARLTANQTLSAGVSINVLFGTEIYDLGTLYDASNYRYVPGTGGYYMISVFIQFQSTAAANDIVVYINALTSAQDFRIMRFSNIGNLEYRSGSACAIINLPAGCDTRVYASSTLGGTLTGGDLFGCHWTITRMS